MLAAIDLGSNSFRLQIGEYVDGAMHIVRAAKESNKLAAGLDENNQLADEVVQKALKALRSLRSVLDQYSLNSVRAVATNTLRVAANAPDFLVEAEKALGYPIEVISGEEEGRLIYLGVDNLLSMQEERRLVIDIGGGSTEIIRGKGREIERVGSFSVGTVGQSVSFSPADAVTAETFEAAVLSACRQFQDVRSHYSKGMSAYGSSGTMRAIAEIIAANGIGDGHLTSKNLDLLCDRIIATGKISRLQLLGLRQERAVSIVGGLSILIALMREFNIPIIQPVASGLRMGIMWDLCLQSTETD